VAGGGAQRLGREDDVARRVQQRIVGGHGAIGVDHHRQAATTGLRAHGGDETGAAVFGENGIDPVEQGVKRR